MNEFKSAIININDTLYTNIKEKMRIREILFSSSKIEKLYLEEGVELIKSHLDFIHKLAATSLTKLKKTNNLNYGYCYYFSLLIFYIAVSLNLNCDFHIGIERKIDFCADKSQRIGHAWTVVSGELLDETNVSYLNSMLVYRNERLET